MPDDDRLGGRRAPRTTTGRVPFVWVQDDDTGHRYDVLETALRPGMTPVEGVDKNYTGRARRSKHRTDLAGGDATGQQSGQPQTTVTGAGDTSAGDTDKPDTGESTTTTADKPATSTKGARR